MKNEPKLSGIMKATMARLKNSLNAPYTTRLHWRRGYSERAAPGRQMRGKDHPDFLRAVCFVVSVDVFPSNTSSSAFLFCRAAKSFFRVEISLLILANSV